LYFLGKRNDFVKGLLLLLLLSRFLDCEEYDFDV